MAIYLLAIVCLVESLLMTRSLITRSRLEKTRSIARILLFTVFSILALTEIVHWSFRWYGLAALLCVWATAEIVKLIKRDGRDKQFQTRRVILNAISASLLAFMALAPALVFPQYDLPKATGTFEVETDRYTLVDGSRIEEFSSTGGFRKLNVECWYPKNADEAYPLILFSHGGLGTKTSNESLFIEFASHGYVVCSIDHAYHSFWTKFEDGTTARLSMDYFTELQREDAQTDKQQSYKYYQKWMKIRTGDINFVLDVILENAANGANGLYRLIDPEAIGVVGHSLGGSAMLAIPRQRNDVDAVIALESPFLYDIVGVENGEFVWLDQPYPVPVLNVYSDSSWDHLSEWPQYARNYESLSNPNALENAHNLHLSGAGHFSLTDLSLASPLLTRLLEGGRINPDREGYLWDVNLACLKFFDRYLKNIDQANDMQR